MHKPWGEPVGKDPYFSCGAVRCGAVRRGLNIQAVWCGLTNLIFGLDWIGILRQD
jgi:hypothetical protein